MISLRRFLPLLLLPILACTDNAADQQQTTQAESMRLAPKYSLAQWSFNRNLFAGEMTTVDFITAAGEMNFEGVEYVSQFFQDKVEDFAFLDSLNATAAAAGVQNLMIMVDNAGQLGTSDSEAQEAAILEHQKWVRAAKYLGCRALRVNAHGDGSDSEIMDQCVEGIGRLADYANEQGVTILIENHGGISNNGAWLVQLLERLSDKEVKALPDFDNWCTARANGQIWGAECIERYDRYQGMAELMPYAQSLSVKSFEFDTEGNETVMDYPKLFDIIQESEYDGYLGIEYEGDDLPSREGIEKTRALAERVWK